MLAIWQLTNAARKCRHWRTLLNLLFWPGDFFQTAVVTIVQLYNCSCNSDCDCDTMADATRLLRLSSWLEPRRRPRILHPPIPKTPSSTPHFHVNGSWAEKKSKTLQIKRSADWGRAGCHEQENGWVIATSRGKCDLTKILKEEYSGVGRNTSYFPLSPTLKVNILSFKYHHMRVLKN